MTTYSITLTDYQKQVLEWVASVVNAEMQTSLTVGQFLQMQVPILLSPHILRFEEAMPLAIKQRYAAADEATKQEIRTILGV